MFLRSRRRTRVASLAMVLILQARPSCQALGMKHVIPERAKREPGIVCRKGRLYRLAIPDRPAVVRDALLRAFKPAKGHFFLPAIGFALPLRVRAFVCVRWPRTGRLRRWRRPREAPRSIRRLMFIATSRRRSPSTM